MRRFTAILIAVAALSSILASAGPASAASSKPCAKRGSETFAKSRDGRVFRSANGAFYGCLYSTGATTFLSTKSVPIQNVHTVGPFAAFSRPNFRDGESGDDIPTTVVSIGLCRGKSGRSPRRYKYVTAAQGLFVTDMVMSRHGDIAWIAQDEAGNRRVLKLDADAQRDRFGSAVPVELAAGPDIDPKSLTLSGSRLSYRQGGAAKTTTLKKRVATCRA
jgi:hypothetical protein